MYGKFAKVYDVLQDIDYNSFVDFYEKIFGKFGLEPKLVLDLACGTGNVTIPMARRGYDMIGIDLSAEMLDIASEKARLEKLDILFLNQDMTEFELYGTVDAIVCSLDGVNYLTEDDQVKKLFSLAENYLNPNGLFVFDINSEYKLKNILGNNTFIYDEDGVFCVWDNVYDEDSGICGFNLDFFTRKEDGTYIRESEYQEERVYREEKLRILAEDAGLLTVGCFADRDFAKPDNTAERIFFVLQKK